MSRRTAALSLAPLVAAWTIAAAAGVAGAQIDTPRRGFSVRITTPENQAVIFGKTRIAAEVEIAEPELVDRVEFLIDDEVIFVDREPPYEALHDFGEDNRSWVVRVVAHHREGVTVGDAIITRRAVYAAIERVNRVLLWVSATDREERFVTDLEADDLRVSENGVPQRILEFYREDRPITLAILLDSSGSMEDKLDEVHEAAASFVETLRPEDRALVIDFDDKVFLIQELTSDHEALKEAITSTEALGATALFDVLHAAYRKIGEIEGRKAIVLLSDGEDTASQFGYRRVLEEAKTNNTIIYAIGLGGDAQRGVLSEFAEVTGGRSFFVKKASELAGVYERIAEELRAQFFLAYSTGNEVWDGRWMKIRVESERPGVGVRARRGYFAVRRSGD